MLKDTVTALYIVAAVASLMVQDAAFAVLLFSFAAATAYFGRYSHESHQFEKQLNRIAVYILRGSVFLATTAGLIALITPVSLSDVVYWTTLLVAVLLPGAFIIAPGIARRYMRKVKIHHDTLVTALRSNWSVGVSLAMFALLGLTVDAVEHTPVPINASELLLLAQLATLPIFAIVLEHKHLKHAAAPILSRHVLGAALINGFAMAAVGYASYLFCFWRNNLHPAHIEQTLPLYREASTLALATLLLCIFITILFERADNHKKFFSEYLGSNQLLFIAFGGCLVIVGLATYAPFLQDVFNTAAIGVVDWLTALLAAGMYALLRGLQRHTRLHTRHAVLDLHHKLKI
jgi:magnesium-transporting ATPase (P-type)